MVQALDALTFTQAEENGNVSCGQPFHGKSIARRKKSGPAIDPSELRLVDDFAGR